VRMQDEGKVPFANKTYDQIRKDQLELLAGLGEEEITQPDYSELIERGEKRAGRDAFSQSLINLGVGIGSGDMLAGMKSAGESVAKIKGKQRDLTQAMELAQLKGVSESKKAKLQRKIDATKGVLTGIPTPATYTQTELEKLQAYETKVAAVIASGKLKSEGEKLDWDKRLKEVQDRISYVSREPGRRLNDLTIDIITKMRDGVEKTILVNEKTGEPIKEGESAEGVSTVPKTIMVYGREALEKGDKDALAELQKLGYMERQIMNAGNE